MTDDTSCMARLLPRLVAGPARRPVASSAWRDVEPDALAPVVLVAGGFLTMPGWYDWLAALLRER